MGKPLRQKKRVRELIPPEVKQRTRAAGLPEADWYAGRPYEQVDRKEPLAIGGKEAVRRRAEEGMRRRREESRGRARQRIRRMVARLSGLWNRLRHPRAVQAR
jgi:hypothetical protein